jgi:hypothetical protein
MGVRGTYNTDAMHTAAGRLRGAAARLADLRGVLGDPVAGSLPQSVDDALRNLNRRGRDLAGEIGDGGRALADGLDTAAARYEDLDNSLVRYFGGGG